MENLFAIELSERHIRFIISSLGAVACEYSNMKGVTEISEEILSYFKKVLIFKQPGPAETGNGRNKL